MSRDGGRRSIPVVRLLGIPVSLDYSWFLIFALLTWVLASGYFPSEFHDWSAVQYWLTGAVTAALFFVSLLLHELGHSAVALRFRIHVQGITLFIIGGVARIGAEPPSAAAEFLIALAGPLVSLVIALALFLLLPLLAGLPPLLGVAKYLAYMNLAVALFNLVPGYPLDGGRVLRAVIWAVTRNVQRATAIAASVGRGFALLFILVGVWQVVTGNLLGGLWITFIGWFLDGAARAQVAQAALATLLAGRTVAQAMSVQCPSVPQDATLQQVVDEHILGAGRRCVLVSRGERTVGLLTVHQIKQVPQAQWATSTAGQAMLGLEGARFTSPETPLYMALQLMDRDGVNQLPVLAAGRVVGMLSREDVIAYLRALQELEA